MCENIVASNHRTYVVVGGIPFDNSSYNEDGKLKDTAVAYTNDSSVRKTNHPLMIMVRAKRVVSISLIKLAVNTNFPLKHMGTLRVELASGLWAY